jgi:predicted HTH domain antitoxin
MVGSLQGAKDKGTAMSTDRWKLEHYAAQYGQGKLSMARAAREAGVSVWEMQSYVREQRIPAQYDREEFEHDLKAIYGRLLTTRP